jgi:pimeloyl-ACP methyl ester carboxylesterase
MICFAEGLKSAHLHNPRIYGVAPFVVALLHGGPGAAGEMAPVARNLVLEHTPGWGVLEPLQTATSVQGQIEELRTILWKQADLPATLVGYSWGAWLGFLLAAQYPQFVKKLVLIGSGPFEECYVAGLQKTRLSRLNDQERAEFTYIIRSLADPATEDKDRLLVRFADLTAKTDQYNPLPHTSESIGLQGDIYQKVWAEAAQLRRSGRLLALGRQIQCPVLAIHGDYDPHPAEGVEKPLSATLNSFRFILLKNCGHTPWIERQARDQFYRVLKEELQIVACS